MKLVTPNEDSQISNETLQRIAERLQPRRQDGSQHAHGSGSRHGNALNRHYPSSSNTVRPVNFTMWVQPPNHHRSIASSVHIYTTLASSPSHHAVPLESLRNWRDSFPCLASLHHAGAVDCEIVLLEASINMNAPASSFKGWELGTALEVLACPSFAGHSWHYSTTIYENGESVEEHTAPLPHVDMGYEDGTVKLQPSLLPRFWAPRFVIWDKERQHLEQRGDGRAAEERSRTRVKRMSAVQELYATPPGNDDTTPKRAAVLLWKFSKSKANDGGGKTTWRNLIPPPTRILTTSPAGLMSVEVPPLAPPPSLPSQDTLWIETQSTNPLSMYEDDGAYGGLGGLGPSPAGTLPASPALTSSYYPSFASHDSMPTPHLVDDGGLDLYHHSQHHQPQHGHPRQQPTPSQSSLLDAFDPVPAVSSDATYLGTSQHDPHSQYGSGNSNVTTSGWTGYALPSLLEADQHHQSQSHGHSQALSDGVLYPSHYAFEGGGAVGVGVAVGDGSDDLTNEGGYSTARQHSLSHTHPHLHPLSHAHAPLASHHQHHPHSQHQQQHQQNAQAHPHMHAYTTDPNRPTRHEAGGGGGGAGIGAGTPGEGRLGIELTGGTR